MKFIFELQDELDKQWPGNEVRALDEKGNEYRLTIFDEEDEVTYLKMEVLNVPSV